MFHFELCCSCWLKGPPPPAALSWNACAFLPLWLLFSLIFNASPLAPGTRWQTCRRKPPVVELGGSKTCGQQVRAFRNGQGEGTLRGQLFWARQVLASSGDVPESLHCPLSMALGCSSPPGRGHPGPRGGWGRAKTGVPGGQSICSAPKGFTEGFPASCCHGREPRPTAPPLAEAHPRALTQPVAPGWYPSCAGARLVGPL